MIMNADEKIETERWVGTPLTEAVPATVEQMRLAIMLGRLVHRGRSISAYEFNGKLYVQGRSGGGI